jgi:hypothetical protein
VSSRHAGGDDLGPIASRHKFAQLHVDRGRRSFAGAEQRIDVGLQKLRDLDQASAAHTIDALLVLLDLLKAHAELVAELLLADIERDTPRTDRSSQQLVAFFGCSLQHYTLRSFRPSLWPSA